MASGRSGEQRDEQGGTVPTTDPTVEQLLEELAELEETVDDEAERRQVRETLAIAQRIPGTTRLEQTIRKYTTRDVAESFIGSIVFALPLLVEDFTGIADWLLRTNHAGIDFGVPVFLVVNVCFAVLLTTGLLYWVDIREVQITNPLLGVVPRRLLGVLLVSFSTVVFLFFLWGKHLEASSPADLVAQLTVVWVVAALGATLGDILPGESSGYDIRIENLDDIVLPDD
jgi:uncharacterized membrane protein